jgi:hypothetical protein
MGYRLDRRGSILGRAFLSTPQRPEGLCGPPSLLFNGPRPGHEADHSPLSNAEVKNGGAIPPLMVWLN